MTLLSLLLSGDHDSYYLLQRQLWSSTTWSTAKLSKELISFLLQQLSAQITSLNANEFSSSWIPSTQVARGMWSMIPWIFMLLEMLVAMHGVLNCWKLPFLGINCWSLPWIILYLAILSYHALNRWAQGLVMSIEIWDMDVSVKHVASKLLKWTECACSIQQLLWLPL